MISRQCFDVNGHEGFHQPFRWTLIESCVMKCIWGLFVDKHYIDPKISLVENPVDKTSNPMLL